MAKKDKIIKKWETTTSCETWETVKSVLEREGFKQKGQPNGSHSSFVHPTLTQIIKKASVEAKRTILKPYGPDGRVVIIRSGNKVPSYVLKRIFDALSIIEDFERIEKNNNN